MTLSVQKIHPSPPEIIIELPNVSPTPSIVDSQEEVELSNDIVDVVEHPSPNERYGQIKQYRSHLTPTVTHCNLQRQNSRHSHDKKNLTIPHDGLHTGNIQASSPLRNTVQSKQSLECNRSKESIPKNILLDVPQPTRSLRHSNSLRSTHSYCEKLREHANSHDDPTVNIGNCDVYHKHREKFQGPTLDGSVYSQIGSQYSALELLEENKPFSCTGSALLGGRHGRPKLMRRVSVTYSSSNASSSQFSTGDYANSPTQFSPLDQGTSVFFSDERPSKPVSAMRRSVSMTELTSQLRAKRLSHNSVKPKKILDVTNYRPFLKEKCFGGPRKFVPISSQPIHNHHKHLSCFLKDPSRPITPSIASTVNQRRHTEGDGLLICDGRLRFIKTRRAQSVSSHPIHNRYESIFHSQRSQPCCAASSASCIRKDGQNWYCNGTQPVNLVPPLEEKKNLSEMGATSDNEILKGREDGVVVMDTPKPSGPCLCQLIVLLVSMQITLGIVATGLGVFLLWKVPRLPAEEYGFWAAIPVSEGEPVTLMWIF